MNILILLLIKTWTDTHQWRRIVFPKECSAGSEALAWWQLILQHRYFRRSSCLYCNKNKKKKNNLSFLSLSLSFSPIWLRCRDRTLAPFVHELINERSWKETIKIEISYSVSWNIQENYRSVIHHGLRSWFHLCYIREERGQCSYPRIIDMDSSGGVATLSLSLPSSPSHSTLQPFALSGPPLSSIFDTGKKKTRRNIRQENSWTKKDSQIWIIQRIYSETFFIIHEFRNDGEGN